MPICGRRGPSKMRFLSVADRELRSAARQKATYRTRWMTATLFFGLLVWLLWAFGGFTNQRVAPEIFKVLCVLTFLYCLFLGTARTADCISVERREGTLGLLFLTNLNSAEIIVGKLCSSALASVYGLMAIFPMLALPLLMGGITFGHFARTVVALLNGILFALAAGFLASVVCKRQFTAIALALGLTVGLGCGSMLGAAAADSYRPTKPLADWLTVFSPLYTLLAADGKRLLGSNRFWLSAVGVAGVSLGGLGLATLLLARTWRDRPKSIRPWHRLGFGRYSERIPSARRAALRRRLLAINPLFWLAARQPVSAPVIMFLAVALTLITVYVAAPFFGRMMGAGTASPVVGCLFAWLWTGLAIHALVLYYAAMSASQRLAEDKQTGALELLLITPITERTISRGLWLAYARKMLFPALLAVLVHGFFIWMLLVMMTLDPPARIALGATPGQIFWSALLDQPLRGQVLNWQFGFILRIPVLILLQLMVTWPTLGWVGRWLGVRMKHPGFAPMASLALLFAPPVLLFSLACYLADKFNLDRLPERQFLPVMMWLALAIGIGHCLVLSIWAANRLRHHLRPVAMSRYEPLPPWRWRLPSWRAVRRFAIGAAVFAVVAASLVASYYSYHNWRSKSAWRTFQTSLKQGGESLDLSPLLPERVPDNANFARTPAFLALLSKTNHESTGWFERMRPFDLPASGYAGNSVLMDWSHQSHSPLHPFVSRTGQQSRDGSGTKRQEDAAAILRGLQSSSATLRELAAAAVRLPAFQTSTNHDARAVLQPVREPILLLERLHLLFKVRACASLAMGQNADAAEDVLAGLRLARLARQLPDAGSTVRVQVLLTRSLQPLWEGLSQQAWTEPQLAALQHEIAGFNLLADYTNAIRRVVLAHIEVWRAIPDSTNSYIALPTADGGYRSEPAWQLQPRSWWFESCIQLHNAGRNAIEQVDVATGRIQQAMNWSDLNGLSLDSPSRELLQQSWWWGANPASVAFVQTSVNQATIACALERFRLANRACPETLEQLVPVLLARVPHDAVSGRPMIYQPVGEGRFILRGVGPNGIDDRKNNPSDDWLWTYSTNAPSANK
jgi:ABC-type transport system involved in multi-copper enzyme maturation permease subunit